VLGLIKRAAEDYGAGEDTVAVRADTWKSPGGAGQRAVVPPSPEDLFSVFRADYGWTSSTSNGSNLSPRMA